MMMRLNKNGSAYVEYFIAAIAFTATAIWMFDSGNFQGLRGALETQFNIHKNAIRD